MSQDKEILKRVYQDQLRDLRPKLVDAELIKTEAERELAAAQVHASRATHKVGQLQGRIETVVALAAAEGITLD